MTLQQHPMPPVLQQPPSQPIKVYGPDAQYQLVHGDAFNWLDGAEEDSIEAVVTDPPYGLVEYSTEELRKRRSGVGGVWRIPPSFDGSNRSPLPRFTVLSDDDRNNLRAFFDSLAARLMHVLVPGGHVFIATNPLVADFVYQPFLGRGFEKRGEIIRLVQTLRGGDRPKNAEAEYPDVSVMPRSRFEPWGLFRKPLEGRVSDNLRKWRTGGLRRVSGDEPFSDVIPSAVARGQERAVTSHPSLKPQRFMRQLVRASLPLGEGVILDPFMGSGSTVAAASACGLRSIGIEINDDYFHEAVEAIPLLSALPIETEA